MARPRVFISSTFYDLKHVRASLDLFVRSLGFDSVLSEKGDIAYTFDRPLDESCYAEVATADILVLIVGGRYGTSASDQMSDGETFFDRYESITKKEYERAAELEIPIYILIDKAVHAEYQTFRANRENDKIKYAHVDSVNVFELIDQILTMPKNNPLHAFERFTEVEEWLREQWAGLFRELLKRTGQQAQLRTLSEQVAEMRELNETLKTYMEKVVATVAPTESSELISLESKRRDDQRALRRAAESPAVEWVARGVPVEEVVDILDKATTSRDFLNRLMELYVEYGMDAEDARGYERLFIKPGRFLDDLNVARKMLGRSPMRPLRPRSETRG